jgi:hypothetical protein
MPRPPRTSAEIDTPDRRLRKVFEGERCQAPGATDVT